MSRAHAACAEHDLLSAYLDGELAAAQERAVEDHLAACPGCCTELDGLRTVVDRLQGLQRATPPAALGSAVARRVALETRPKGLLGRLEAALRRLVVDPGTLVSFGVVLALVAIAALFVSSLEESGRRPIDAGRGEDWSGVELVTVVVAGRTFDRDGALWRERGAGEAGATITAESPEAEAVFAGHPHLRRLLGGSEGIVLATDAGTVRIEP
jgi:hypothetical protein